MERPGKGSFTRFSRRPTEQAQDQAQEQAQEQEQAQA
jgi:hypothetical protein